ncbi:MAG TPA: NmrA family NAD(P)-binding protein [Luteimonas sp.]|nr:NmrA family NAD(P)-binding protein [Luteimonas sp.]
MHIVLGATGHVGSAVVRALLSRNEPVTAVTRNAAHAQDLRMRGAEVAEVDILDAEALRAVFRRGRRAFLLNPPADIATDTDAVERRSVSAILAALEGSGLEKVVAESTYGAQPGHRNGDFGPLYALEQGLAAQSIPATIQRAAYYMSNWDAQLDGVRESGKLQSFFPPDFALPMVSPQDLGETAAGFMTEPADRNGVHYVEGPQRYRIAEVAEAISSVVGRAVEVDALPRSDWRRAYRELGFSEAAAESYERMTAITLDAAELPDRPVRGRMTLQDYFRTQQSRDDAVSAGKV